MGKIDSWFYVKGRLSQYTVTNLSVCSYMSLSGNFIKKDADKLGNARRYGD